MIRFSTIILVLTCFTSNAQVPWVEWHKCLGSSFSDYAQSVQPTSDGGFIVAGYSTGFDNGDVMGHASGVDIWIVKLDKSGSIEWKKILGGTDSEQGAFIIQTPDGGYMVAGSAASRNCEFTGNHGQFDFWVAKLNSKGEMIWQKQYGGTNADISNALSVSADGSYYVAGWTLSNDGDVTGNHGLMDYWVIKIDAAGKLIWQKTLGGTDYDNASSVQATADGGCVLAGSVQSLDGNVTGCHGAGDYWVVKLDKNGNMQWQKALGGSMSEFADCIQVTKDGGYIVSGIANSHDGDVAGVHGFGYDAWIVKLDPDGKINWQHCYGGKDNETAKYIQNTADGGYVFTGSTYSSDGDITCNAGMNDVLLVKISSTGSLEWQKTVGGAGSDDGAFVQPLNDGGFIIAATTSSADIAGYHTPDGGIYDDKFDYLVIKLSAPAITSPAPIVTIDPGSSIVCAGKPATISASVVYGGVNPIYQWMKNGVPAVTNNSSYTDNFANNDQVTCMVKSGNTCENAALQGSDMITIKQKTSTQNPEIKISTDNTAACNCASITIKASVSNAGGAPVYQWMINGNIAGSNGPLLISNHLNDGDVITCSYTDNTSCAAGPILSNAITIGGGSGAAPLVTITAAADTICKGASGTFTANPVNAGTNPVYQWKINNMNTGTNDPVFSNAALSDGDIISCSIKVDPLFTCTTGAGATSNNIVIHVMSKLTASLHIAASTQTICAGSPVTFTATATGAGSNPVYQWRINGVNTGTNNKVYSSSSLANNDVVSCVLGIDPLYSSCVVAGQATSQNIPITVTTGTVPSVAITADRNNVCAGEPITFTAIASNAGTNPTYQWLLNNAVIQNNNTVYTSNHLANGDQLLCRMVPGAGACAATPNSSNFILAIIKETPIVYVSPADTAIASGKQVQLRSQVTGSIVSYVWVPADKLINALSFNPQTILLTENTSYTLTVANDKGCKASATAIIKIGTALYMPNAFTPNNDRVNDMFRIPPNTLIDLKEFAVFDRWGNKVFTTTDKNTGWNGTVNGKKQHTASYVYYINGIINNKTIAQKGSFLLVN